LIYVRSSSFKTVKLAYSNTFYCCNIFYNWVSSVLFWLNDCSSLMAFICSNLADLSSKNASCGQIHNLTTNYDNSNKNRAKFLFLLMIWTNYSIAVFLWSKLLLILPFASCTYCFKGLLSFPFFRLTLLGVSVLTLWMLMALMLLFDVSFFSDGAISIFRLYLWANSSYSVSLPADRCSLGGVIVLVFRIIRIDL